MIDPLFLLASLLTGIAGAGHCAGMCGGIAGALAHAIPPERRSLTLVLGYSVGRVGSYMALGALAGGFAALLTPAGAGLAMAIARVFTGLLMLAIALYLLDLTHWLRSLEIAGSALWRKLSPLAKRMLPVDSLPRALGLGALWGLLPCGLVYGALLYAATSGSSLAGALAMLAFGLGTLPAVLGLGLAGRWLSQHARNLRRGSGSLLLLVALWTLLSTALALPAIIDGRCRSPGDVMQEAISVLMQVKATPPY